MANSTNYTTGQTIYNEVVSVNTSANNIAVSGATFDTVLYKNGAAYTGVTVTETLVDDTRAVFMFTFSADTIGQYQIYTKNNSTNVVWQSEIYNIGNSSGNTAIVYVGL